jgi:hypothetical protein
MIMDLNRKPEHYLPIHAGSKVSKNFNFKAWFFTAYARLLEQYLLKSWL